MLTFVRAVGQATHCENKRQNKTPGRSSLDANGTLSSMIQIKLANSDPCTKWEPSKDLLKAAKGATKQYNDMHKK